MLSYRIHVYKCAMAASAEAVNLAVALAECVALRREDDYQDALKEKLPDLVTKAASLDKAIDMLLSALPQDLSDQIDTSNLDRHLYFIRFRLGAGLPSSCAADPIDIARQDLPYVIKKFDAWCERQSPLDNGLGSHLKPLIIKGELNSALREAWVTFKDRMVRRFDLTSSLDGPRLADKLFGPNGTTLRLLDNQQREGYLSLFKGLYALSRNPVAHSNVPLNPSEVESVLELINSAIIRIDIAECEGIVS